MGPNGAKEGPRGPQRARKWAQKRPGRPIHVKGGSEMANNCPRSLPDKAEMAQHSPKMAPRQPKMAQKRPQIGPRGAQDGPKIAQYGPKMGPRWPKMAPRWPQVGEDVVQMDQMKPKRPKSKNGQKPKENLGFCRVRGSREGPSWAQEGPSWAQDGSRSGEDGQDGRGQAKGERKMVEDEEHELEDAAQDRQKAVSDRFWRAKMKKEVSPGSVEVR